MVSIVISNFSNFKFIKNLINSINENIDSEINDIIIVDNSNDFLSLDSKIKINIIKNKKNIGHGPSMEKGIEVCRSDFALILDCDTIVYKKGLVELMKRPLIENEEVVASGVLTHINHKGADCDSGMPYLHPYCLMVNRKNFLSQEKTLYNGKFCRFTKHGAPCMEFFKKRPKIFPIQYEDIKANYCSPVNEYIYHIGRSSKEFNKEIKLKSLEKWNFGINIDKEKISYWIRNLDF